MILLFNCENASRVAKPLTGQEPYNLDFLDSIHLDHPRTLARFHNLPTR